MYKQPVCEWDDSLSKKEERESSYQRTLYTG